MQGKPWTPPQTKLAPVVVSAAKELFDQGMADPRGCEYREVEIASATPSDGATTDKVHAWVLPGEGKTRFCIAWNGLEYPVISVGPPADIRKDITPGSPDIRNSFYTRWGECTYGTISEKSPAPVKAALLLRIGEAGLAEQLWNEGWLVWTGSWTEDTDSAKSDPYAIMAQNWLDAWYSRALAAHTEGNDAVALQLFRSLQPMVINVKATAAKRQFSEKSDIGIAYLAELRQLPDLIADQERRAKEPPRKAIAESGTLSSRPDYIAALVKDL